MRGAALAVLGGLLAAASCPPVTFWPAMLVALVVLAHVVATATSTRSAAVRAGLWAAAGQLVVLRFVVETVDRFTGGGPVLGVVALLALVVVQSVPSAAAAALAHVLRRRLGVPLVVALPGALFAASFAPAVFPWSPGAVLGVHPPLVQGAELVGAAGVSTALWALATLLDQGLRARAARPVTVALGLLVLLEAAGHVRIATLEDPTGERLDVALVSQDAAARRDPDVEPEGVVLDRLLRLSREADRARPDLVVWPEAAHPFRLDHGVRVLSGTATPVAGGAIAPRLVGVGTEQAEPPRVFNSVVLVTPDGQVSPPYDKQELLPFGETVPFGLDGLVPSASDTTAGRSAEPVTLTRPGRPPVRLGVLVCYEDVLAGPARRTVAAGAQLLVDVSNDAWFAGTAAPRLQQQLARVRAVETRTSLVRSVNRGPSTWVDDAGRIRAERSGDRAGVLTVRPVIRAADAPPTAYVRLGDAPLAAGFLVLLAATAAGRSRRGG